MTANEEDFDSAAFMLGDDDDDAYLDIVMENLSNMISPKNSGSTRDRPFSPPSTSSTSFNAKISPLITDMESIQIVEPATSVRGVDANNNPIYATSQTPYGFQVMTKRKTSKKSIFNFENFALPDERSDTPKNSATLSTAMDTSAESPVNVQRKFLRAKPRHSHTDKPLMAQPATNDTSFQIPQQLTSDANLSPAGFDSMDETIMKSGMGFSDENEYLEALKWNGLSPHTPSQQFPPLPTPKNPRKKADTKTDEAAAELYHQQKQQLQEQMMYLQQQQLQQQQELMMAGIIPSQGNMYMQGHNSALPYMSYYSPPINTSEALRASWMNPSSSMTASAQAGNDLSSQLQYYSGDISQLQLPSIRNAPPAVIPDRSTFDFPFGSSNVDGSAQSMYPAPVFPSNAHLSEQHNPANLSEILNYQALLQRKMDELKQQSASLENTSCYATGASAKVGYVANNNRNQASHPSHHNAESDGDDGDAGNKANGGRASKSLSEISKRFVTIYGKDNTLDYIAGKVHPSDVSEVVASFHRVDAAAEQLGVHVRRIYELIKILEILSLVQFAGDKRGKFSWRGNKDFLRTLGEIQEDGLRAYPLISAQSGLLQVGEIASSGITIKVKTEPEGTLSANSPGNKSATALRGSLFLMDGGSNNSFDLLNLSEEETAEELLLTSTVATPSVTTSGAQPSHGASNPTTITTQPRIQTSNHTQEEHFMVEIICKKFLQLFLVGMNDMSMSHAIQKLIPMEENQSLIEYNRANATKIRRVYDVTNVLCSLNLIRKQTISRKAAHDAELHNNMDNPSLNSTSPAFTVGNSSGSSAAGKKANTKNTNGANINDRIDAKVLEWASFNPLVIREQYLLMCGKK